MLHEKTIAIFISDNDTNIENIDLIYSFFENEYEDFVIFSDQNSLIPSNYAIIPSIYLKFFQGTVIFLSAQTYLEKENILANNIYVCTSTAEILQNHIPKNRIANIKILTIENNKIEVINYAKL